VITRDIWSDLWRALPSAGVLVMTPAPSAGVLLHLKRGHYAATITGFIGDTFSLVPRLLGLLPGVQYCYSLEYVILSVMWPKFKYVFL